MQPTPTLRELEILKIIWDRGEATVREVHEELSRELPIVQNTVQAFLRTMEEKGLVEHRVEGRTFVYRPLVARDATQSHLAAQLLQRVFDGAIDQLVQSVFDSRRPSQAELDSLEALIAQAKAGKKSAKEKGRSK
jgi:predicted transcriptional regulator